MAPGPSAPLPGWARTLQRRLRQREYQRLIAAFECTSRQLLPADLAALPHEAIAARLMELRAVLGGGGGR